MKIAKKLRQKIENLKLLTYEENPFIEPIELSDFNFEEKTAVISAVSVIEEGKKRLKKAFDTGYFDDWPNHLKPHTLKDAEFYSTHFLDESEREEIRAGMRIYTRKVREKNNWRFPRK